MGQIDVVIVRLKAIRGYSFKISDHPLFLPLFFTHVLDIPSSQSSRAIYILMGEGGRKEGPDERMQIVDRLYRTQHEPSLIHQFQQANTPLIQPSFWFNNLTTIERPHLSVLLPSPKSFQTFWYKWTSVSYDRESTNESLSRVVREDWGVKLQNGNCRQNKTKHL